MSIHRVSFSRSARLGDTHPSSNRDSDSCRQHRRRIRLLRISTAVRWSAGRGEFQKIVHTEFFNSSRRQRQEETHGGWYRHESVKKFICLLQISFRTSPAGNPRFNKSPAADFEIRPSAEARSSGDGGPESEHRECEGIGEKAFRLVRETETRRRTSALPRTSASNESRRISPCCSKKHG